MDTEKLEKINFNFNSILTFFAGEVSVTWTSNNEAINLIPSKTSGVRHGIFRKVLTVVEVRLGLEFVDVCL